MPPKLAKQPPSQQHASSSTQRRGIALSAAANGAEAHSQQWADDSAQVQQDQARQALANSQGPPQNSEGSGVATSSGEKKSYDEGKRNKVLKKIREAKKNAPKPKVAVSNRPGFGYDSGVFTKTEAKDRVEVMSAPPGFKPLPQQATNDQREKQKRTVIEARGPNDTKEEREKRAKEHLEKASGLYIPGGQDIPKPNDPEKDSRENYEQALIARARNTGMPTLAVCGGSRCLARGFGVPEAALSSDQESRHNKSGTAAMAHGLVLKEHTILGGAGANKDPKDPTAPPRDNLKVNQINSTHKKVVATATDPVTKEKELAGVKRLPVKNQPELTISAQEDHADGLPEGFETTHGAPIVGVTSHPEAIYGGSSEAAKNATEQGKNWSANVMKGFVQSMESYEGRKQVNEEIRKKSRPEAEDTDSSSAASPSADSGAPDLVSSMRKSDDEPE